MKFSYNRKHTVFSILILLNILSKSQVSSGSNNATISQKSFFDIDHKKLGSNETENNSYNETIAKKSPKRPLPQTEEEREEFKSERYRRMKERREKAREKIKSMIEEPQNYLTEKTELMSEDQINALRDEIMLKDPNLNEEKHRWLRSKYNDKNTYNPHDLNNLADPGQEYSEWAQAYRMLGAFISCDNGGVGYYGGRNEQGCSRWIMWAAYVDPNYKGYGRNEYFGYSQNRNKNSNYYGEGCQRGDDGSYHCYSSNINNYYQQSNNGGYTDPIGKLDCHSVDTDWLLLGVYRQEFYEFFEQVTKHLWYYNDYEYIVAYSGLNYLNDGDCNLGGYDEYGDEVYAAPKPLEGGSFEMSLYRDWQCLIPVDSDEKNYDEFFGNYYANMEEWGDDDYYVKSQAQTRAKEYTMTLFNEVFEEFKYCTLCIDYPSYQDGYFNGNYGTDEDDLINQCWKFYSHDSYHCTHECIALGDAQGTITQIKYGKKYYGLPWEGQVGDGRYKKYDSYNKQYVTSAPTARERLRANIFFMFNAGLFLFTYYMYQNAGQFRDIIGFDDVEEGGLKDRRSNKKERLLHSNHGHHKKDIRSSTSDPPWYTEVKRTLLPDGKIVMTKKQNEESHLKIVVPKKREKNDQSKSRQSKGKGNRSGMNIHRKTHNEPSKSYEPPDKNNAILKYNNEKSPKVVVNVIEKRLKKNHPKIKQQTNVIQMNLPNARVSKERVKTPKMIIENMPTIFEKKH